MYDTLALIAQVEFADIIVGHTIVGRRAAAALKLRLFVVDGSYVDIWLSLDHRRFSYHWEQRSVRGLLHRHDNAPDHLEIPTFPKHFHDGSEDVITVSTISSDPIAATREFLTFVRQSLTTHTEPRNQMTNGK
jgi:hypothetical protein